MPRPLRVLYPNAWYHVMNRGAGRRKIFTNNHHRTMFLKLLEECHDMFNVKIYAYCLMDNHYHLLLSTPDANLSRVMRHINGVYTQKFNRSLKTDGPLFRGRYKAKLVDDDCYQLLVSRYIHLNPVEAGIVNKPSDYKWSSYPAYLGLVKPPNWLSINIIIDELADVKTLSHARNYQDYVEEKTTEEINIFSSIKHTAPIIGSEMFKEKILAQIDTTTAKVCSSEIKRTKTVPEIKSIINHVCLFYNISTESLVNTKRGKLNLPRLICIYLCRNKFGYTLRSISKSFQNCRPETVSSALQKLYFRLANCRDLQCEINEICNRIKKEIQVSGHFNAYTAEW